MGSILKVRDKDGNIIDVVALKGVGIADITCDGSTESGGTNWVNIDMTDGSGYVFTILNGQDGAPGQKGNDGVSPTVNVSKSGKVTTVHINTKDKVETATINDGEDGYTPIKGTDYFTESEIDEIEMSVLGSTTGLLNTHNTSDTSHNDIRESLALKANADTTYTKTEVDNLIATAITATMEASY